MITFNSTYPDLIYLLRLLGLSLTASVEGNEHCYEILKDGKLVGNWNEVSGDGDIMVVRLFIGEQK